MARNTEPLVFRERALRRALITFGSEIFCTLCLLPLALAAQHVLAAQPYPTRPVRLIVASAPGGAPDILARTIAQKLSENAGQQFVVDNRAGASGIIGAETAAKAAPDGYTLFLATTTLYAILPHLTPKLPYDPQRDFASITQIALAANVLVVNPALAVQSVSELVELARMPPGNLNYASAGNGTPAHLAGEMLNVLAGVKTTHVPHKGAGPALIDLIAGQVQIIITSPIAAGPHINSGKVRALATTGAKRNPALPALPAVAETLPGYEITQWWGISAPVKTPPAILSRLHREAVKVIDTADVRERIHREGAIPVGGTPREFDAFIAAERSRLGDVIRKAGIALQ
jgi:tripartite-type tricarboxylate transporter receptor subunit TctC